MQSLWSMRPPTPVYATNAGMMRLPLLSICDGNDTPDYIGQYGRRIRAAVWLAVPHLCRPPPRG
jgi:hypothetical protein